MLICLPARKCFESQRQCATTRSPERLDEETAMNCPKCGKPMTNETGWQCVNLKCPEAHKKQPCRICGLPPAEVVKEVATAIVVRCPNGHEYDLFGG
jgi:hypothetical protein